MSAGKIMVVEDDLALSAGLCFELDMNGYLTVAAYNTGKARQLVATEEFDLVLLDVNLPDGNGMDLCRELKEECPQLPVIFLTANDLEEDVVAGFDLGADDYVTKPFSMKILLKRVEAALRHAGGKEQSPKDLWADGFLSLDFGSLTARRGQEQIAITPNEYKLLRVLTENEGNVLTRQTLLGKLWDSDFICSYGMGSVGVCSQKGSALCPPCRMRRDPGADSSAAGSRAAPGGRVFRQDLRDTGQSDCRRAGPVALCL